MQARRGVSVPAREADRSRRPAGRSEYQGPLLRHQRSGGGEVDAPGGHASPPGSAGRQVDHDAVRRQHRREDGGEGAARPFLPVRRDPVGQRRVETAVRLCHFCDPIGRRIGRRGHIQQIDRSGNPFSIFFN